MYSTTAILAVGSTPVYADITLETLLIDPDHVQHRITPRTKAIVATHLYGRLCRIEELKAIADKHGIVLVEDCAQAHGAMRGGIRAGAFGTVSCFSFFPTKNLGALGDAGAVVTSDDLVAQSARTLRQYGWSAKYNATTAGGRNSRLDEVQAAILRVKLTELDEWNSKRRSIAGAYLEAANGTPVSLHVSMDDDYVAHLCVTRTPDREAFARHLDQQGVENTVHYPIPDYAQKAVAGRCEEEPLPRTEAATSAILTLPCFPEMSNEEVSRVCGAIATFR
jgi:dTDP-4-amino-4,6-dideoxygalactose transaminase